jgi:glycosyltransferase involved in cell wall biosynthesis
VTAKQRIPVMHLVDTLTAAGAERVAVNIVNHLPRDKYVPYLCTTRSDGPLDALVAADVIRLRLQRRSRFDFSAVLRLRKFLKVNKIRIVHAHSSSLVIARLATMGMSVAIVWHAHYGRYALENRRAFHYQIAGFRIAGAITVSQELAQWCSRRLRMADKSVWYLPNPVCLDSSASGAQVSDAMTLPGTKGARIVCVANFRTEKDHFTLLRAMVRVMRAVPEAHLLLAGKCNDREYLQSVQKEISKLSLTRNITLLGERSDIPAILRSCDIGVLSSASEGLPMSLLEYGAAGLPAVATEVGQCAEVLDHGKAGVLVPAGSMESLSVALISLLQSPQRRQTLGESFRSRVSEKYDSDRVIRKFCEVYTTILARQSGRARALNAEAVEGGALS